jgi:hypothetical protein
MFYPCDKKSSDQGISKFRMKIFLFRQGTGLDLSRFRSLNWVYNVGPSTNYLVQLCSHVSIKSHIFSQSLGTRFGPSLHWSGISLATVLIRVRVDGERIGDHDDDNFQVSHCCASSTSHCFHHANGGAVDGRSSWAWGRRWRCSTESWPRGICRHEDWTHPFPGSCVRAFALALCRSVFCRWQLHFKWWRMLGLEGLLQWTLRRTPSCASNPWSLYLGRRPRTWEDPSDQIREIQNHRLSSSCVVASVSKWINSLKSALR